MYKLKLDELVRGWTAVTSFEPKGAPRNGAIIAYRPKREEVRITKKKGKAAHTPYSGTAFNTLIINAAYFFLKNQNTRVYLVGNSVNREYGCKQNRAAGLSALCGTNVVVLNTLGNVFAAQRENAWTEKVISGGRYLFELRIKPNTRIIYHFTPLDVRWDKPHIQSYQLTIKHYKGEEQKPERNIPVHILGREASRRILN